MISFNSNIFVQFENIKNKSKLSEQYFVYRRLSLSFMKNRWEIRKIAIVS